MDRFMSLARVVHHPIAEINAAGCSLVGKAEVVINLELVNSRQLGLAPTLQPPRVDDTGWDRQAFGGLRPGLGHEQQDEREVADFFRLVIFLKCCVNIFSGVLYSDENGLHNIRTMNEYPKRIRPVLSAELALLLILASWAQADPPPRFVDVAALAGVATPSWSTGAALGDYDLDGDLDLYVANYLEFQRQEHPALGAQWKGLPVFVGPRGLTAAAKSAMSSTPTFTPTTSAAIKPWAAACRSSPTTEGLPEQWAQWDGSFIPTSRWLEIVYWSLAAKQK
jgi:hypothetical protein